MKIIDAHLHMGADAYFDEIAKAAGHENNAEHLAEQYRARGMVHGIIMGNLPLENTAPQYPRFMSYCVGIDSRTGFDRETIKVGETEFTVMHTPGHTVGSCCFITDGVIFSGDTLFRMSAGRTDFPGGSVSELRHSLQRLAELEGDYQVYPGHEDMTTLSFERKYNMYM